VIELGTNSPGEIEILTKITLPDIAVITNVGCVHLEKLKNIDGVIKEKSAIFSQLAGKNNNVTVIPYMLRNHPIIKSAIGSVDTITFGDDKNADISIEYLSGTLEQSEFDVSFKNENQITRVSWPLAGSHLALNAGIGFAVGKALKISPKQISLSLSTCSHQEMRMQISHSRGICLINDAYNANPDSMMAFVNWLPSVNKNRDLAGALYLVLGDMLELGENEHEFHVDLLKKVSTELPDIKTVVIGERMKKAASGTGFLTFTDTASATRWLLQRVQKHDIVAIKGSRGMKLDTIANAFN
jgi:UDP-N-acetylmuramoyl-tripeptide--D-alanyl-D-alanine ligase